MEGDGDHNPTPPVQTKDNSILIHVSRKKKPVGKEETLEDMELNLQSSLRNQAEENSWYILQHTATGPKISEIFHNIPQNQSEKTWLDSTSSAIVGSSLYVIGGLINPDTSSCYSRNRSMSNCVRRLDLNNPSDGWMCSSIQFRLANVSAQVVGDLICLISTSSFIERVPDQTEHDDDDVYDEYEFKEPERVFGLVYDTIEQVAYSFEPPPGCDWSNVTSYLPLEGRGQGLVFPFRKNKSKEQRVYLHDPVQNSWEHLHDYSSLTRVSDSRCLTSHKASNGILYMVNVIPRQIRDRTVYTTILTAYDLNSFRKLFRKKLPIKDGGEPHMNMWLVPNSDFELCLLWYNEHGIDKLFRYAKIWISLDPHTVCFSGEISLSIDVSRVLNCLPFNLDDYPCPLIDPTCKKQTVLAMYWTRCCKNLLEENMRLKKGVEKLKPYGSSCIKKIHVPMLAKEKSILIHVSRVADPTEAQGCEELELQIHQSKKPQFICGGRDKLKLPKVDSWYIIQHTATGPQISEIFHNVPQDHPNIYCHASSSVIVGSSLYVIGGRYNISDLSNYFSNEIRRLDVQNLAKGWEISKLPYYLCEGHVEVADNFIYLLPRSWFRVVKSLEVEQTENVKGCGNGYDACSSPWGLVYDTIKHETNPLKLPQGYINQDGFGFHLKGRGVLVPLGKYKDDKDEFYIHDPRQNSWELLDSYFDFDPNTYRHDHGNNMVVSDGMLFLFRYFAGSSIIMLRAYDYNASSADFLDLLFEIELPQFSFPDFSDYSIHVVAVDDLTFCLLGYNNEYDRVCNTSPLLYAKISLSLDPYPIVSILEEKCFHMDAIEILNCLPFDSDLHPSLFEESAILDQQNDENPLASSSSELEATEEEVYWKQRFKKLMEENKRLQKEVQELKGRKIFCDNNSDDEQ